MENMDPKKVSFGIDLGTTHSCAAVQEDGKVEIITNPTGGRTTPSYILFKSPSQVIVGDKAKQDASRYPGRALYDIKRMIGRSFQDIDASMLQSWPFNVVNQDDKPLIKITFDSAEQVDAESMIHLKERCEAAKKILSYDDETDFILNGVEFTLTHNDFLVICTPLFNRVQACISKAFEKVEESGITLNKILLVGGSSHLRQVEDIIKIYFKGVEICRNIDGSEAIARGAAIAAAYYNQHPACQEMLIEDVIPFSMGIELSSGKFLPILKKHKKIPARGTHTVTTPKDYTKSLDFVIYEGDHKIAIKNHRLGSFTLDEIEYAKRGVPQIEVTFDIGDGDVLKVLAKDKKMGITNDISIDRNYSKVKEQNSSNV